MNLIIVSLAILGALSVICSFVDALVNVHNSALWVRMLSILLVLGGYVGFVALIMFLLRIPLS
jgi:hypothetical protein